MTQPGHLIAWTRAEKLLTLPSRALERGSAMRRRKFITLVGGLVAYPMVGQAEQKERVRRIGILMPFPRGDASVQARVQAFRQELLRLGWSEGGNVQFDERWSTDNMDVVRADAASLVELKPDVILTLGDRVIPVFMNLTNSIPIVVGATSTRNQS